MRISVVLSTYNGSKYLTEQLDSLRMQSRHPDEVIISDDNSSDDTVAIIKEYIKKYQLASWKLIERKTNIGWKKNFSIGLQMAQGDWIFPCDQDDIWHLDKIERMSEIMNNRTEILLLASGFTPFYEDNGKRMHLSSEIKMGDEKVYSGVFEKDFFYIYRPGCVYCFRRTLLQYFSEYSCEEYPHDAFLWRTASLLDGLYFYRYSTIDYRRHSNNATGREKKSVEKKLSTMLYYEKALKSAQCFVEKEVLDAKDKKRNVIKKYQEWCELRISFLREGKFGTWIHLLKYRKFYYSTKTYLADLGMVLLRKRGLG